MAWLAEVVLGLSLIVCTLELLGTISLFRTVVAVPTLLIVGIVGWLTARGLPNNEARSISFEMSELTTATTASGAMKRIAVVVVAIVVADWSTRTVDAYHHGMTGTDTLWYHLPTAARFVQEGSITPLHFFDLETVTAFFPANSELFHALGILLMGNDVLSPAINLGWLSLALLAGWCIGRPAGVQILTLTAVASIMATPNMVATQPGGGYNDIVVLALLLSAAAILVNTHASVTTLRLYGIGIAALSLGLAAGSKFTALIPAFAMTVGVIIVARRGRRILEGTVFTGGLVLTGGLWYVRNWVTVGNPLPSLHIKLGPLALPNPVITTPSSTLTRFLLSSHDWSKYFFPGLRLAFGPLWWALFALSAIGLLMGSFRAEGAMARMVAVVGVVIAIGFVVSPQYLAVLGVPIFFVDNIRYADPAIVFGLVVLPMVTDFAGHRWRWCILLALAVVVLASQLDETLWPLHLLSKGFVAPITGIDAVLGVIIGLAVLTGGLIIVGPRRRLFQLHGSLRAIIATVVSVALFVGAGYGLERFYMEHRYESTKPLIPPFRFAQSLSSSRIGMAGLFTQLQYPLYGRNLSNYVQYIGVPGFDHSYAPATTCRAWRQQVNAGHYDYVVTSTGFTSSPKRALTKPTSYSVWTNHDPNSVLVHHFVWALVSQTARAYVGFSVFKISGHLSVSACNAAVFKHVLPTPP